MTVPITQRVVTLTPAGSRFSPRRLHRSLMSQITSELDPISPRSDAHLLWRRDGETLVFTLRSDVDIDINRNFGLLTSETELELPNGNVQIDISICAQQSKSQLGSIPEAVREELKARGVNINKHARGKRVRVIEDEVHSWAQRLLQRSAPSAEVTFAQITDDLIVDSGTSSEWAPVADVVATVSGEDFLDLSSSGVGRMKNYGLGLPVLSTLS